MGNGRVAKKRFINMSERRRKVRRPRLSWPENVEKDIRTMNINRLRQDQGRPIWVNLQKKVKDLRGSSCSN